MKTLYDASVHFYKFLIWCFSFFNTKAKQWIDGRKNLFDQLQVKMNHCKHPSSIWVHCASLGEFEQARPLIEKIKINYPHYNLLLTFFSPSGYEIRKNYSYADCVCYLPLDTKQNAREFISITKPSLVFFTKYEYWYHYINELHKRNIPLIVFSAIFRENQIFFKWYGQFFRDMLKKVTMFFVQDERSKHLLHSIGITNVEICSDTRFDRVIQVKESVRHIEGVEEFKKQKKLMVCGSVWEEDMNVLIPFINRNISTFQFIIAPHEIHHKQIAAWQKQLKCSSVLYSSFDKQKIVECNVLLIDSIGLLSALYSYADIAYVGGAFSKGLHNILEASVYGIPVFFGPKYKKYREAVELIELKCAFPITNSDDLASSIQQYLQRPADGEIFQQRLHTYFESKKGGTEMILNYINKNNYRWLNVPA
ncbi:MAG: 3-deoxy-D-manno-octulosonic acid transferase [Cytophagaceae bacterium]|nr:3-deoxy-D-manno-octulosonic acid transferase [Cytophagaceae bacterium]MDW8456018.1 glycosyltransferase N-terminal domain-containing protein [Cytophagaceae bacterium]